MPARVSVIVTILNEAKHLPDLLGSLATQEPPFEVLIVDAGSHDGSVELVSTYARAHPEFRLLSYPGRRGASRNHGVAQASGEFVAFVDGDCTVHPDWLRRLRAAAEPEAIVAGRTILFGYWAFEHLQRVELEHQGQDVTVPSCNLLYSRDAFLRLEGFDDRFITAEDIDLNFRAVAGGLHIRHAPDAIVYHRARESVGGFLKQAYWNGYGRKQLTLKHGALWSQYSFRKLIQGQLTFWGLIRLVSATLGYLHCRIREHRHAWTATAPGSALEVQA